MKKPNTNVAPEKLQQIEANQVKEMLDGDGWKVVKRLLDEDIETLTYQIIMKNKVELIAVVKAIKMLYTKLDELIEPIS